MRRSSARRSADLAAGWVTDPPAVGFDGDDHRLVEAVRERQPAAVAAFHDRFATRMMRILVRIVGRTQDLEDLLHDTFLRAFDGLPTLVDPARLDAWMTSVAVFTARTWLQRRWRQRWLTFLAPSELTEFNAMAGGVDPADHEVLACTYAVLDRFNSADRILLALRLIEGMELAAIADATGASLTTVKRRLRRAETRFVAIARSHPVLSEWVEKGGRWTTT